jgi:hypothetical protein
MRSYGAEYNNIERGEAEFNIVLLSTKNINLVEDHPVNISGKFG